MASGPKAERSCLGWPGCPPMRRLSWPCGGGGLGGLTMSEDGGLDDVEEALLPVSHFSRGWISMWYRDLLASRDYPGRCSATRTPRHKEAARAACTHRPLAPSPVPLRLHGADLRYLPPYRHRLVPLTPAPLCHRADPDRRRRPPRAPQPI